MTRRVLEWGCAVLVLTAVLAYSSGYAAGALAGLLLVTLGMVATGTFQWIPTTLDRPLVALLVVTVASGLVSEWPAASTASAVLFAVAALLTVFTTALIARRWPAAVDLLVVAWIAGALLAAAWGIARAGPLPDRASTPALLPTALGTTLAAAVILALGTWSVARTVPQRLAIALGLTLLVAGLELTWSRGAMLAAAAGAGAMLIAAPRARLAMALVLTGAVVVATLAIGPGGGPLARRLGSIPSIEENADRRDLWIAAQAMVRDYPLLGIGFGNFAQAWPRYRTDPRWGDKPTAHNIYLNFAAETGLLGLAAFLVFIAAGLGGLWRRVVRSRGDGRTDGLWAALFAATVAVLVHQLFDATLMSPHMGYGFIVLLTLGAVREP